jgi:hypothetical protein
MEKPSFTIGLNILFTGDKVKEDPLPTLSDNTIFVE